MIRDLCNQVYQTLGPGYSERIYHNALEVLLRKNNIPYETERIIPVVFEGHTIGNLRGDLIVDGKTIVELKAIKTLTNNNNIQALNYIKLTGIPHALLVNFPQTLGQSVCEFEEVRDLGPPSEGTALQGPAYDQQSPASTLQDH